MQYPHTVIVVHPNLVQGSHSLRPDWAGATRTALAGVKVSPMASVDASKDRRAATTASWLIVSQPGVRLEVASIDRIEWTDHGNLIVMEVVGEVLHYEYPSTGLHWRTHINTERTVG